MQQLATIFSYVAGGVIFIATIFMLRAIFSGSNGKKSDSQDGND